MTGTNLEPNVLKIKVNEDENREIDSTPVSTPRTAEFYRKRPCDELVWCAANILHQLIIADGDPNQQVQF